MMTGRHAWSKRFAATAMAVALLTAPAWAGPEGTYTVKGENPGGGSGYSGRVTVTRTGETYSVVWDVSGTQFAGSGLGAAPVKGSTIMGPADDADYVLAVGYMSEQGYFGLAYYVEQADGTWKGIWTFGGSKEIGTETWTPR